MTSTNPCRWISLFSFLPEHFFSHFCNITYHTLRQFVHVQAVLLSTFLASSKQSLDPSQPLTQSQASGSAR